jgi:hypothetical protein
MVSSTVEPWLSWNPLTQLVVTVVEHTGTVVGAYDQVNVTPAGGSVAVKLVAATVTGLVLVVE